MSPQPSNIPSRSPSRSIPQKPPPQYNHELELVRANRHFIKTGKLDYFSKPWKERERERRLESNRRTYQRRKERLKLQKLKGLEKAKTHHFPAAQGTNPTK